MPQHPPKAIWRTPQSNITNYISNTYNTKPQLTNKKTIQNRSNKNWFTVTTEQNNANIYNSFDYPIAKAHNLFFCELETEMINNKRLDSFVRVQPFDTIGNHEVLWSETYQRFTLSCFLMPLSPTTNNLSPVINTARPRRCFSGVYGRCTDFPQQYAMFCDYFFIIKGFD